MAYDQNRPEEPQRPPGDEKPARRRIGRSWGPAEETADEGGPQGSGQQPEPYRFDPDRGRRHRYSEEPTGQVPNVEIAETGPMVPATRRPSPGEQFEPIPPAPQHQQHPESPFAPPAANREHSAPNHERNPNRDQGAPHAGNQDFSAPPPQEFSAPQPPPAPDLGTGPMQQFSAPASPRTPVSPPHPNPPQRPTGAPSAPPTPQPPAPPAETTEPPSPPVPPTGTAPQQLSPPPAPTPAPGAPAPPASPPHPPVVTEQHPPRTPPTSRQPLAEPTPPVNSDDGPADPDAEALLERVRRVHGVRDAYHVTAPDGSPSLRLELEEGVDPDEVHAAVSAVVNDQRAPAPAPQSAEAPVEEPQAEFEQVPVEAVLPTVGVVELRRVEIHSSGLDAEVSVTLAAGDQETGGQVVVPPVDWHVEHGAASATVEALRPHLGVGDARVEVEHASIVDTGPVTTAVVVVLWLDGRSVRRLAGAAPVASERVRAIVSATLSALAAEVAH